LIAGGVDWWRENRSAVSFSSDIYLYCFGSRCDVGTSGSGPVRWFSDTATYSLVAFVLFLGATPDGIGGYDGRPVVAMVIVLAAVALRETWARRLRYAYAAND
jgi:hypothetical protein